MRRVSILFIAASLALSSVATAQEQEQDDQQSSTWRFEFANDAFVDSDNQFTNGFALQKHSPLASSLSETTGTAAFGKSLARFFLPKTEGLYFREAWSFGQNMQTPEAIELPDIILDDVPYLGLLAWSSSFIAFDDQRMTGFGWLVGIAGPDSFAEDVQKAVHKISDAEDPQGWEHQIDNEPVVSFFYTKKRKLWRTPYFDGAASFNAALSNFMTLGEVALEMRFGRMPQGFTYVPDPIARGLHYNATIPSKDTTAIYASLVVRATGLAVNMPREGNNFTSDNEWTENNTIEPEDFITQVFFGLNFERPKWAFRLNFWVASDSVKTESLTPDEDSENEGGTITFEWRF